MGQGRLIGELIPTFVVTPTFGDPFLGEDVTHGSPRDADFTYEVTQFSDRANGSAWYKPDSKNAAVLLDVIAENKSLAVRLTTDITAEKLREAQRNNTVLSSVVFAIVDVTKSKGTDWSNAGVPFTTRIVMDAARLTQCQVTRVMPIDKYLMEVHLKARYADSRRGGCGEWDCGSNHNEIIVRDIAR